MTNAIRRYRGFSRPWRRYIKLVTYAYLLTYLLTKMLRFGWYARLRLSAVEFFFCTETFVLAREKKICSKVEINNDYLFAELVRLGWLPKQSTYYIGA